ncbi:hypothetical protein AWS33_08085 [Enterobacter cloacae subsp. cloacae]|nr:hypothetical protein AWS33_08085 [Enterobacter cloacae subsp. cloacae]
MSTVYHYCSTDAFLNIVKYKKLWLGDIEYMNDFMEMKWFMNVFNEIIASEMCEAAYKKIHEEIIRNINLTRRYMCCLSESGDILSQWRSYAQDGTGVSIGFNPEKLKVRHYELLSQNINIKESFFLNKVSYISKERVRERIIEVLSSDQEVNNFFSQNNRGFVKLELDMQHRIVHLMRKILHLAIHIKNPAFSEEKEVRLVYNHMPSHHNNEKHHIKNYANFIKSKNYRISNGNLTSYYEFPLFNGSIQKIILGPKNKFNENEVKEFLKMHNHQNVEIERSKASYR